MPSKDEYDAAIRRVKETPANASKDDYELARKAAQQQGEQGNRAKEALGQKRTGLFG